MIKKGKTISSQYKNKKIKGKSLYYKADPRPPPRFPKAVKLRTRARTMKITTANTMIGRKSPVVSSAENPEITAFSMLV